MILLFGQFVYCGKVLRLNPYKRRLPSDVTFVDVLRYMCWKISLRYNMYLNIHVFYLCLFCYLFFMLGNWENTFRKLMGMLF